MILGSFGGSGICTWDIPSVHLASDGKAEGASGLHRPRMMARLVRPRSIQAVWPIQAAG